MIIGIDIDDTITNTSDLIRELAKKEYPDYKGKLRVPKDKYEEFQDKYVNYIHANATLKEGVVDTLNYLKENGCTLLFITYRGFNRGNIEITKEYFKKYNIPYDDIISVEKDKGIVAKEYNVDLFIEDKSEVIEQMIKYGIDYIKMYKENDNNNYRVVNNWKEIKEILKERINNYGR